MSLTATAPALVCKICGGPEQPWFTRQERQLVRCTGCGLVSVPDGLVRDAAGVSIYESEDNIFVQEGNDAYYLDETNLWSCRLKVDWIRRLCPSGRLLDAGANYGHFLKEAQEDYDASGFELSPQAVRWSREKLGVRNEVGSIYDPPAAEESFDVVTSWDVIEHLEDPLGALTRLRELLKPGGCLFLSTPDAGSGMAKLLGSRWYYLDPIQHLNLFSFKNLSLCLQRSGFEVLERCSFGRYYRLQYIADRLGQLYRRGVLKALMTCGTSVIRLFGSRSVYIKLGDVMGVAARRVS